MIPTSRLIDIIVIPHQNKEEILRILNAKGINRESLDTVANAMKLPMFYHPNIMIARQGNVCYTPFMGKS